MYTRACAMFGIRHPVVLAPMGGATDARLVAAVSAAGGLGLSACTWTSASDLVTLIGDIRAMTDRPFGLNFVLHIADPGSIDRALAAGVPVLSSFRGDPTGLVPRVHAAGALSVHQVTTLHEAEQALDAGVDALIVQGNEAGGHCGPHPLMALLPAVIDRAGPVPVLAAGGLVDGRGLAAVLALGASGMVMGTRFIATPECPATTAHKQALLAARPGDTVWSPVWDILWGEDWPGVGVRALRNAMLDRWHGRPAELAAHIDAARAEFAEAEARDDPTGRALLAGCGAGRIGGLLPAGQVVADVVAEAAAVLAGLAALPRGPHP